MINLFNYIKYILSPEYLPDGNIYYMFNNEYDEIIVSGFKPVYIIPQIPYEEIVTLYFVNYNNPSVNKYAITKHKNLETIFRSNQNIYFEFPPNVYGEITTFKVKRN